MPEYGLTPARHGYMAVMPTGLRKEQLPMSDETQEVVASVEPGGNERDTPPETQSQADIDRIVADRLSRDRAKREAEIKDKYGDLDELQTRAARLQELEEADKTELQKAQDRADAAERKLLERAEADRLAEEASQRKQELDLAATEIVAGTDVPATALRGTTREELLDHFEQLKSLIPSRLVIPGQGDTPSNKPSNSAANQFAAAMEGLL